jgi:hypothetical protein
MAKPKRKKLPFPKRSTLPRRRDEEDEDRDEEQRLEVSPEQSRLTPMLFRLPTGPTGL